MIRIFTLALLLLSALTFAQNSVVQGTVLDFDNFPMPGAVVVANEANKLQ